MRKVINHLVQLQDLTIARAQQEASMPGVRLAQLDAAIQTMLKELPDDIEAQFSRLQGKEHIAIVPVSKNNVCSACGMSLPVSLIQAVRQAEKIHQCLNCARMLYYSDSIPRQTRQRTRRGEPPKVGVARFSSPELMIPQLTSIDREGVLVETCKKLEAEKFIQNSDKLVEEALKREAIVSTAVDHGLAFPHVRGVEGGGLSFVVGVNKKGIKFGGPSKTLTHIIFFMVIPTAASAFYLKLLSGLTQTFHEQEARDKIMATESPAALWKTLVKTTRPFIR